MSEPIVIDYKEAMAQLTILEEQSRRVADTLSARLRRDPENQELRRLEAQAFGRWTGSSLAKAAVAKCRLRSALRGLWP